MITAVTFYENNCLISGTPAPLHPGRHRLAGTVTVDGIPSKRDIFVIDRMSLSYVAGTKSDTVTGEWEITGLPEYPEGSLIVLALDNTATYNAEVADYVSQVATAGV